MLILVRGLPGSGKSTYANSFKLINTINLEADMFFIDEKGKYVFKGELIKYAHEWCINTARIFMNNGHNVLVSNTFTTLKEMKPYIEHAQKLRVDIKVYRMINEYKSIHDVPEEVIEKMKARFEDYPGEIRIQTGD